MCSPPTDPSWLFRLTSSVQDRAEVRNVEGYAKDMRKHLGPDTEQCYRRRGRWYPLDCDCFAEGLLSGFPEAIRTAFPETKVQLCIVHLVRAALRYVTDTDGREVAADLRTVYQLATVLEAEEALESFDKRWGQKYPTIVKQWRAKWSDIVTLFEFPAAIRKAIYTTNTIEGVNGVTRKFTRNRKQYPNGESALKLVYLAIHEASRKWTMPIVGWKAALNHFAIVFEGRVPTPLSN